MPNFFKLTFGLAASAVQTDLLQWIKSQGGDAIQISDGLCVRSAQSIEAFKSDLEKKQLGDGIQVQNLDKELTELSADIKAFLNQ